VANFPETVTISTDVLDQLITGTLDKDKLIQRLIQFYPEIFVRLTMDDDLSFEIQRAFSSSTSPGANRVAAIKRYRELTGTKLPDAKKAVDDMIDKGIIIMKEN
jgi:hypothetical protein